MEGLETLDYLDNLQGKERSTEQGDSITFEGEVGIRLMIPSTTGLIHFLQIVGKGGQGLSQHAD